VGYIVSAPFIHLLPFIEEQRYESNTFQGKASLTRLVLQSWSPQAGSVGVGADLAVVDSHHFRAVMRKQLDKWKGQRGQAQINLRDK
jgi:hypothetical protein